jgi:hypothetical protein
MLRLRASQPATERTRAKAVIFVYLFGGPSHVDTFDMKPDAPAEYRGEFKPVRTTVPWFDVCELMPQMPTIADKLALVRNLAFNPNFHDPVELFSGFRKPTEAGRAARPDLGAVVSWLRKGERRDLPAYVSLDKTAATSSATARRTSASPTRRSLRKGNSKGSPSVAASRRSGSTIAPGSCGSSTTFAATSIMAGATSPVRTSSRPGRSI